MDELIRIEDVSKIYNPGENEVRALDQISVTIYRGEYVAIIGQSEPIHYFLICCRSHEWIDCIWTRYAF